jgi:hypothetical protein
VGVPAVVPIIPVVVLLRLPAIETLELIFRVVPASTEISLLTVFVPSFVKVVVPVPEVERLYSVIAPVVPPPIFPVPVIVMVGVPDVVITPDVALVRFAPIETLEFMLSVVPAFTASVSVIVFVPSPENVTVPATPTVRL